MVIVSKKSLLVTLLVCWLLITSLLLHQSDQLFVLLTAAFTVVLTVFSMYSYVYNKQSFLMIAVANVMLAVPLAFIILAAAQQTKYMLLVVYLCVIALLYIALSWATFHFIHEKWYAVSIVAVMLMFTCMIGHILISTYMNTLLTWELMQYVLFTIGAVSVYALICQTLKDMQIR